MSNQFPPELLRAIFEHAALNDVHTSLSLCLVSKWAYSWIEPTLFRVVNLFDESFQSRIIKSKSPVYIAQHVHHLAISEALLRKPEIDAIASAFSGVTNLYAQTFTNNDVLWPPISPPRITLWHVDARMNANAHLFANVTHFDGGLVLAGWSRIVEYCHAMQPTLTHLSLRIQHIQWEDRDVDSVFEILSLQHLQVFMIRSETTTCEDQFWEVERGRPLERATRAEHDPRLVFLVEDGELVHRKAALALWEREARAGRGRFEEVESLVACRRMGSGSSLYSIP